jgi:hypothetical protein
VAEIISGMATRSIFPDDGMASSCTSTVTGISKAGSKHTLEPAHAKVLALSVDPSRLYEHLAFGYCVPTRARSFEVDFSLKRESPS